MRPPSHPPTQREHWAHCPRAAPQAITTHLLRVFLLGQRSVHCLQCVHVLLVLVPALLSRVLDGGDGLQWNGQQSMEQGGLVPLHLQPSTKDTA